MIIGKTDNILIVFLNLKLVLAIKSAKAKPKTVDENAVRDLVKFNIYNYKLNYIHLINYL